VPFLRIMCLFYSWVSVKSLQSEQGGRSRLYSSPVSATSLCDNPRRKIMTRGVDDERRAQPPCGRRHKHRPETRVVIYIEYFVGHVSVSGSYNEGIFFFASTEAIRFAYTGWQRASAFRNNLYLCSTHHYNKISSDRIQTYYSSPIHFKSF
jgi:hypothetical protein